MSPRLRAALALAVVLAAGWWLWSWWRSPERRISRRLDELAEALSKPGDESQIAAALAARRAAEIFAPGFLIRAQPYEGELSDPQQLMGSVMRLHDAGQRVAVDFAGRDIALQGAGKAATVGFVATAAIDRGSGPGRERWRVHSLWIEQDGEWLISELELVERLESGGLPFG